MTPGPGPTGTASATRGFPARDYSEPARLKEWLPGALLPVLSEPLFDAWGRTTSAALIRAFAFFREHPDSSVQTGLWHWQRWDPDQFRARFRRALHRQVNREGARCGAA